MSESTARRVVNARSGGRCEICGQAGDGLHHRLKRSRGGPWAVWNLLRLCGSGTTGCHGAIEAEPTVATMLGLTLSGHVVDSRTPALCHPHGLSLGWWLPEDDGAWSHFADPKGWEIGLLEDLVDLPTRRG